jgi:hypothetical protein
MHYVSIHLRKISSLAKYKFYLAFENYPVQDYVSEKVTLSIAFLDLSNSVAGFRGVARWDASCI